MLLAPLYARLAQKEGELTRLKTTQQNLTACQGDFHSQERMIDEPTLSAHTWAGSLAQSFELIRQNRLKTSYDDVSRTQLDRALSNVSFRIATTQKEITVLRAQIAAVQAAQLTK